MELLTEYGYYTLTGEEIKAQLRCPGAVYSVTGRPLSARALLDQEVLDITDVSPALVYTGRGARDGIQREGAR